MTPRTKKGRANKEVATEDRHKDSMELHHLGSMVLLVAMANSNTPRNSSKVMDNSIHSKAMVSSLSQDTVSNLNKAMVTRLNRATGSKLRTILRKAAMVDHRHQQDIR